MSVLPPYLNVAPLRTQFDDSNQVKMLQFQLQCYWSLRTNNTILAELSSTYTS
ncbi:MAG: hypothetical protein J6Q19_05400 [Bacteroidaceae bacterium]|nr:hypothetical protein [Bacteroidaceae bacterium]